MKQLTQINTLTLGSLLLLCSLILFSFNTKEDATIGTRTIDVTGSAEMSLKPDRIKLQIQLAFNKKTRKIKEEKLFKILKENGIDKDKVEYTEYNGYSGYYYNWYRYYYDYWHYYHSNAYYHTYSIPVDASMDPKVILNALTKADVYRLWIKNDGFKDVTEQRKKVKIEAIKAAKEKARYLLGAVGEQLGHVVSIREVTPSGNSNGYHPYWGWGYRNQPNLSSSSSNSIVSSNQTQESTVKGAPTDRLKYEVQVTFTIK